MIERCLTPLLDDKNVNEVIVVVDGDIDDTESLLKTISTHDKRVKPIVLATNSGRSLARQQGVDLADSEIILFLDDDVVASPNLASRHGAVHLKKPNQVVVGNLNTVDADLPTQHSFTTRLYKTEHANVVSRYQRDPESILRNLWGGNLSIGLTECREIGIHSPQFPGSYFEDLEFGLRCERAGLKATYDPTLMADHFHSRSLNEFIRDSEAMGQAWAMLEDLGSANSLPKKSPLTTFFLRLTRNQTVFDSTDRLLRTFGLRLSATQMIAGRLLRQMHMQKGSLSVKGNQ